MRKWIFYITLAGGCIIALHFLLDAEKEPAAEQSSAPNSPPSTPSASVSTPDPCSDPLTYRIGSVDRRFDLTRHELLNVLKDVENLWETGLNRELMTFREDGDVAVHLIYGEKQKRTEEERQFSGRIERVRQQISELKEEHRRLSDTYQQEKEELQNQVRRYKKTVAAFNEFVEGGVPPDKKQEARQKQRQIEQLESEIRQKEQKVESRRRKVNRKTKQINERVDRQNKLISEYNRKFTESGAFNQGEYKKSGNRERINIYQFGSRAKLTAVLAHEFGHAFGIEHVSNPESIMYRVMKDQNFYDLKPTRQDIQALKRACGQ